MILRYEDDNAHLAVMTQAVVQDWLWIDEAAEQILASPFPAYLVPKTSESPEVARDFFVIVAFAEGFLQKYEAAWRRLAKDDETFKVVLYASADSKEPGVCW